MLIARASGYPLDALANVQKLLDDFPDDKSSLLLDYDRWRPVEIVELIFSPLSFARAAGIATPTIDVVAAIADVSLRTEALSASYLDKANISAKAETLTAAEHPPPGRGWSTAGFRRR